MSAAPPLRETTKASKLSRPFKDLVRKTKNITANKKKSSMKV